MNENTTDTNKLSQEQKSMLLLQHNMKSKSIAYLLLFFLGYFGVHRFYVKETKSARIQLGLVILMIILSLFNISFLSFVIDVLGLVIFIWWIVDFFLLYKLVDKYNENLIRNS